MPHKSFLGHSLSSSWLSSTTSLTNSSLMGVTESNNGQGLLTYDNTKYVNNSGSTLKVNCLVRYYTFQNAIYNLLINGSTS